MWHLLALVLTDSTPIFLLKSVDLCTYCCASFGNKIFITCSNSNKKSEWRIPFLKWMYFFTPFFAVFFYDQFFIWKHNQNIFLKLSQQYYKKKIKRNMIHIRSIRFFIDYGSVFLLRRLWGRIAICLWYWRHLWIRLCLKKSIQNHSFSTDKNHSIPGCVHLICAVGKLKENFILH